MNRENHYCTIAAHLPWVVAQAVRKTARSAGFRSVSAYLGEVIASEVLRRSDDAQLHEWAQAKASAVKLSAEIAERIAARAAAEAQAEGLAGGEPARRAG